MEPTESSLKSPFRSPATDEDEGAAAADVAADEDGDGISSLTVKVAGGDVALLSGAWNGQCTFKTLLMQKRNEELTGGGILDSFFGDEGGMATESAK